MGDQFFHYETYSRVASTAETREGHSIYTIAGEADRIEGYCSHIIEKKEPIILYGVSFSKAVEIAEEYAEKTIDSQNRKVKKKDFIMIAGTISAPPDMSEEVWNIYKMESLKWLIRRWGMSLRSVVEHVDEFFEDGALHRHLHFACVPEIGVRFYEIHPPLKAKREADLAYGISKKPELMTNEEFIRFKKYYKGAGIIAYKKKFIKEQDDFFKDVSDDFGLSRYGPKRLRYSNEDKKKYFQEKRIKQNNILERKKNETNALEHIQKITDEAEKKKTEAEEKEKEAARLKAEAEQKEAEVDLLKVKVEKKEKEANKILENARNDAHVITKNAIENANTIEKRAKEEAVSTIKKAKGFINTLLNKISELTGGKAIVDWARTFIKSLKPKDGNTTNDIVNESDLKNTTSKDRGHEMI